MTGGDIPYHVQQEIDGSVHCIFFIRPQMRDGTKMWAYVSVALNKMDAFVKAQDQGFININDFGELIMVGYGDDPEDEIKEYMEKEYAFSHDEMVDFS